MFVYVSSQTRSRKELMACWRSIVFIAYRWLWMLSMKVMPTSSRL